MERKWKYTGDDSMSDLVEGNYAILLAMSRFHIGLGFGEKSIYEVCVSHGVDTGTFLSVVNVILDAGRSDGFDISEVSPPELLEYLADAHDYYLKFRLPTLRGELSGVLDDPESDLARAIVQCYDECVAEIRRHVRHEEKHLFPYVRSLLEGNPLVRPRPDEFYKKHDHIEERLAEFKRLLIKYCCAVDTDRMNDVLYDIYNCEDDLVAHCRVEDLLLAPLVMEMESKIGVEI